MIQTHLIVHHEMALQQNPHSFVFVLFCHDMSHLSKYKYKIEFFGLGGESILCRSCHAQPTSGSTLRTSCWCGVGRTKSAFDSQPCTDSVAFKKAGFSVKRNLPGSLKR